MKQQASIPQAQVHQQQQPPPQMHPHQLISSMANSAGPPGMLGNWPPNGPPPTQQQPPPSVQPQIVGPIGNIGQQIEAINSQQIVLRDQIRQSELNLSAQHGVIRSIILSILFQLTPNNQLFTGATTATANAN